MYRTHFRNVQIGQLYYYRRNDYPFLKQSEDECHPGLKVWGGERVQNFEIEEKGEGRKKVCHQCGEKNSLAKKVCRNCGQYIRKTEILRHRMLEQQQQRLAEIARGY